MTVLTFSGEVGEFTLPYTVEYLSQSPDGDELVATGLIDDLYPFYYSAREGRDEFFVSWDKHRPAHTVFLEYKDRGYHISCADEGELLGLYGYGWYDTPHKPCTVLLTKEMGLLLLHQHLRPISFSRNYRQQTLREKVAAERSTIPS